MKHILLLRPGALGDALLTFPVIQALRRQSPDPLELTLVSHPAVLPLARAWGLADLTDDYSSARWSELFFPSGIRSPWLLEKLSQTDLAVGWLRDEDGLVARNLSSAGCRCVLLAPGRPPEETHEHIVHYLARTLGLELSASSPFTLASGLTPLQAQTTSSGIARNPLTVAIHPGSGGARKCWPLENFALLINSLQQRCTPVLLLSGPADEDRLAQLLPLIELPLPGSTPIRVLKNLPLLDLCWELQACRCYLGNDAGMTHLAALFGLPTIALFGPSDPRIWRPVGPRVQLLYEAILTSLHPGSVLPYLIESNLFGERW